MTRGVRDTANNCAQLLLRLTVDDPPLPPPSPDYWEMPERHLSIATAALVAVGLERAGRLDMLLVPGLAEQCKARASTVHAAITEAFGPSGFERYAGRDAPDAGVLFLLPPYTLSVSPGPVEAMHTLRRRLARPAGGIAPGSLWRRDGVSWTPQTALLAQAHAHVGSPEQARDLLDWLSTHRTDCGSLPEKVLADGSPAQVAPLAWTAATVISAALGTPKSL